MKQSLEQGAAGSVVQQVDPIPGTLYSILHKLGMSGESAIERLRERRPGALFNDIFAEHLRLLRPVTADVLDVRATGFVRSAGL